MNGIRSRHAWSGLLATSASLVLYASAGGITLAKPAKKVSDAGSSTVAANTAAPAPNAVQEDASGQSVASTASIKIHGFRSARFGMTEDEVRAAIIKDFKVAPSAIKADENKIERTRMLLVDAPDVLPGGGDAQISYVFGFETKKLIQTGLTWSKTTDSRLTPEQLFSNANVLRAHFSTAGYKPDTIAMNLAVAGGLLMFRGADADARTTLLVLHGDISPNESKQRVLTPTALTLFYVADAKKPDVYRLPPGLF